MPEKEDVTVLVSAAAVQLSFGLPEYSFGFFDDIYIIKSAYTYGSSTTPWAGHVNERGIHVAWDHVLQGYASDSDGYNVGLHEMAHALEYEFAYGDFKYDLNADLLYQNAVDNYMLQGQKAMMDTNAAAAALSGGYGNSWAATGLT